MDRKLEEIKVETELMLIVRYIDDIRALLRKLQAGSTMRNGRVEIDKQLADEDKEKDDPEVVATARVLQEVMNSVLTGIQFMTETWLDFKHDWGVPTLDTMWKLVEAGEGRRKKLQYRFFKKPGSTP